MRAFLWYMLFQHILTAVYRTCRLANSGYPAWETTGAATVNIITGMTIAFWAFYLLLS